MSNTQPLHNKRIVVTRSLTQAHMMCRLLESLGAIPIRFPVIEFVELAAPELNPALANLGQYDWLLFTSKNAVRFFFKRWESEDWKSEIEQAPNRQSPIPKPPKIASVGSATEQLLAQQKGVTVDFIPEKFTGEQLVLGLGDIVNQRILLPRAKIGRPDIVQMLQDQGADVADIPLYDTITAVPTAQALAELEKGVDVLTFTSPSSVRNFLKILETAQRSQPPALIACIGPSTAAEAEKFGLPVDIMPEAYTLEGLVTAVAAYYSSNGELPC